MSSTWTGATMSSSFFCSDEDAFYFIMASWSNCFFFCNALMSTLASTLIFWHSWLYLSLISCIPFFLILSYSFTNSSMPIFFSFSTSYFYLLSIWIASECWSGLSAWRDLIDLSTSAILFLNFLSIFRCWTTLFSVYWSMNTSIACSFCCWRLSSSTLQSLNIFLISGSKFYKFYSSFLFINEVFF